MAAEDLAQLAAGAVQGDADGYARHAEAAGDFGIVKIFPIAQDEDFGGAAAKLRHGFAQRGLQLLGMMGAFRVGCGMGEAFGGALGRLRVAAAQAIKRRIHGHAVQVAAQFIAGAQAQLPAIAGQAKEDGLQNVLGIREVADHAIGSLQQTGVVTAVQILKAHQGRGHRGAWRTAGGDGLGSLGHGASPAARRRG